METMRSYRDVNQFSQQSHQLSQIEKQKTLVLYHYPSSVSSRSCRIALAEKNVKYTATIVSLDSMEQFQPWYALLNPKCVVPTLIELDGTIVCTAKDIVHWISHRNAQDGSPMTPTNDREYDMMMDWMERSDDINFNLIFKELSAEERIDADLHENDISTQRLREISLKAKEQYQHRQLGPIYAAKLLSVENEWKARHDERLVKKHLKMLKRTMNDMEDDLTGQGQRWLAGSEFSLADVMWIPILYRFDELGLANTYFRDGQHPSLVQYFERCKARPSVQEGMVNWTKSLAKKGQSASGKRMTAHEREKEAWGKNAAATGDEEGGGCTVQ
jgi:glutathione S-transferase